MADRRFTEERLHVLSLDLALALRFHLPRHFLFCDPCLVLLCPPSFQFVPSACRCFLCCVSPYSTLTRACLAPSHGLQPYSGTALATCALNGQLKLSARVNAQLATNAPSSRHELSFEPRASHSLRGLLQHKLWLTEASCVEPNDKLQLTPSYKLLAMASAKASASASARRAEEFESHGPSRRGLGPFWARNRVAHVAHRLRGARWESDLSSSRTLSEQDLFRVRKRWIPKGRKVVAHVHCRSRLVGRIQYSSIWSS